jgi:hypothetical protein
MNTSGHSYSTALGAGASTTASFDVVAGNNAAAASTANVHFRVAGSDSSVHVGRATDQAAVAGAANQLELHTIFASNQSRSVKLKAPDTLAASYLLTMPPDDGTAGEFVTTDGAGVLDFSGPTIVTGTPTAAATCTADCAAGGLATGGGCDHSAALALQVGKPSDADSWTCTYLAYIAGNCTATVICTK